jgi:hypothetical protein
MRFKFGEVSRLAVDKDLPLSAGCGVTGPPTLPLFVLKSSLRSETIDEVPAGFAASAIIFFISAKDCVMSTGVDGAPALDAERPGLGVRLGLGVRPLGMAGTPAALASLPLEVLR